MHLGVKLPCQWAVEELLQGRLRLVERPGAHQILGSRNPLFVGQRRGVMPDGAKTSHLGLGPLSRAAARIVDEEDAYGLERLRVPLLPQ